MKHISNEINKEVGLIWELFPDLLEMDWAGHAWLVGTMINNSPHPAIYSCTLYVGDEFKSRERPNMDDFVPYYRNSKGIKGRDGEQCCGGTMFHGTWNTKTHQTWNCKDSKKDSKEFSGLTWDLYYI